MKKMYRVYKITNTINQKKYIGITSQSIEKRFQQHCSTNNSCRLLHRAINKYGKENFTIDLVMDGIPSVEEAGAWEVFLIDSYDSTNREIGYNISKGGNTPPNHKGKKMPLSHSENLKKAWREGRLHKIPPKATKESNVKSHITRSKNIREKNPNFFIYETPFKTYQVKIVKKSYGTYKTIEEARLKRDEVLQTG